MKTHPAILALLALTIIFAAPSSQTAFAKGPENAYTAKLISPSAGSVVKPGKVVRVEWTNTYPKVDLSMCETEVLVSLDGGRTYSYITSQRNPKIHYFDWTVPELPGGGSVWAILDIRFGCLGIYPESYSPQIESAFLISND
ncbi:MAG: hypothetical protein QOG27_1910 [Verrucomicrobiota bacterium]|jgi:hypothetical protein